MTDVRGPDGVINRFPDDMPDAEIEKAMAATYGAPKPAKRKPSLLGDINAGIEQAADWATLGGFSNYRAAADSTLSDGQEGFLNAKARNAAAVEDFNQRRPIAGVASKTIGGVAPALLTMGGSQALQAARTAPQGFVGRRISDATSGAGYGAIAGANQAAGMQDPMQMLGTIAKNTGFGAVAGPLFGGGMEAGAKVGGAASNLISRFKVDPNVLGMSGSNIRLAPKAPSTRALVDKDTQGLLKQTGKTGAELRQEYADYENAGIQPTLAELGGARTRQRARTLSNSPGETPDLAEKLIDAERRAQLGRAITRTDQAFGQVSQGFDNPNATPIPSKSAQLIEDLDARKKSMGDVYNLLFNPKTQINPTAQPLIDRALKRIPPKDRADAEASIERYAIRDEVDPETLSQAQRLKYIKEHMDDVIANLEKKPTEQRKAIDAQKMLIDAMEAGVPGYKNANKVYQGLIKQQDALEFGRSLLVGGRSQMSMADARAAKAKMSRQELEAVQAGLRDDIERILSESTGGVDAPRNAIAGIKGAHAEKIRLWLGPQAESYIKALQTMGKSYRDQTFMYPGSGSNTFAAKEDADQAFLDIKPTRKNLTSLADEAAGMAWTKATTPWRQKMRDQQGRILFQQLSKQDLERIAAAQEQIRAAQIEAMRNGRIASRPSGLFGAQFSNRQGQ